MTARGPLLRATLTLATAALASGAAGAGTGPCASPRIGLMAPITGEAAFIGKEQLGLARYAVRTLGRRTVKLVEADTQLDPAKAARAARALHRTPNVLAVVGPAGSQQVLAAARVFSRPERLAFVSASAVQPELTNGSIPSFFRVVPSDRAQAPAIVRLVRSTLKAQVAAVVDDGTTYSRRLADRVQAGLRAGGIAVARSRVDAGRPEFEAAARRVARATDVVFLPFRVAATAQLFGEELRRQGRRAVLVGSDTLDSRDFTLSGSYVAAFAPRVRVPGYEGRVVSKFGAPAYVAAEVAVRAIGAACADGTATRREVIDRIRATDLRRTVLGTPLRFTTRGEVRGATYSMIRLP